jgi:hypothetical protein
VGGRRCHNPAQAYGPVRLRRLGLANDRHRECYSKVAVAWPDSTTWFIQPGIEHKWLSLGKTNIFGTYRHDDAGSTPGSSATGDKTVGASVNFWQAGIIQNIEAADMSFYVVYQHVDGII